MKAFAACGKCLYDIMSCCFRVPFAPKLTENPAIQVNKIETEYLKYIVYKDTEKYVPNVSFGKVVKVYDGDTITIASRIPGCDTIYRFSVRLRGIDCAEIKAHSFAEKEEAEIARNALSARILGRIVLLNDVSVEKYGRLLADVYCDGEHLNKWMLDNNYAVPYDGGTKIRPIRWDSTESEV
jgi:endonuclease YncB( thermonuclease family)